MKHYKLQRTWDPPESVKPEYGIGDLVYGRTLPYTKYRTEELGIIREIHYYKTESYDRIPKVDYNISYEVLFPKQGSIRLEQSEVKPLK